LRIRDYETVEKGGGIIYIGVVQRRFLDDDYAEK
jgi:hypothetical protein